MRSSYFHGFQISLCFRRYLSLPVRNHVAIAFFILPLHSSLECRCAWIWSCSVLSFLIDRMYTPRSFQKDCMLRLIFQSVRNHCRIKREPGQNYRARIAARTHTECVRRAIPGLCATLALYEEGKSERGKLKSRVSPHEAQDGCYKRRGVRLVICPPVLCSCHQLAK